MTAPRLLQPGAEHPITVTPTDGRVMVTVKGVLIADTRSALTLREADYPAVQYIPRSDVNDQLLVRTDTATYCPYKGDAAYYRAVTASGTVDDVAWTYERPFPAVAAIAGHLAFYPDRARIEVGH
jgi:uncharacterized protein (DUF427 family)